MPFTTRAFTVAVAAALFAAAELHAQAPAALPKMMQDALEPLDGDITLPGLREPVEILRDRWGVAHIYARNQPDLFFAQGFVAAQDRLFQIDMWRRLGAGRTAEIVGKDGLASDRFARLVRYRGDPTAEWESYSPDTRAIAVAFTAGINAYIDRAGGRLPIEYRLLGVKAEKWAPEDILGRMSGIIMSQNFRNEVLRAELIAAVGPEKARRIAPTEPARNYAPAGGLDLTGIDRSIFAGYEAATRPLQFRLADGSNNWAIDGTLSASGKPMMASDPHRTIAVPSLRYLVHLNAPGWNVIGAGEPGLPGVALGHNEHVAWGFTIVGTDTSDLFVLETDPKDPDRYRYGDGWEAMTIVRETAHVRSGRDLVDVDLILPFSKLGPVIARDSARNRAVALRWVGSQAGGAAYLGSLALGRVKNADEFVAALSRWKVPGLNMVHADTAGNIGWVAAGSVPVRKGFDGLLPAPGDGRFGWQGFLDLKDLPQTRNPDSHFVATANHNILPAGYAREISYEWSPDTRIRRIRDRLAAKPKFDLDDFRSIQHDDVSIPGRRLAALCRALPAPDELKPFVKLIAEWDGSLNVDTRAGTVYAAWWAELTQAFFRRHVPERLVDFVRGGRGVELMLTALESADPYWFADGSVTARDELLRTTLAAALQKLRTVHKVEPGNTPWGDLHTVTFRHPLSGLRPDFAEAFNVGPLRRSGDVFTPNNTRHDENFKQVHGASYRHVLDLADWDRGLATNAPGQSGRPGSPHYGDLAGPWSRGEYFPLAFSRAAVERVTAHRMTLKPGR